jgi:response regulator of citrate/malate metabolism
MGSHAEECSSLLRFIESIDLKIERMSKFSGVNTSYDMNAKRAAAIKKQKQDTAIAVKAAMAFDFSKVKKQKKPFKEQIFVAGMTSNQKAQLLKEVIALHKKGTPVMEIAQKLKINKQTARIYLLRSGHKPIPSVKMTKDIKNKVDLAIKYHKQGMALCDIVHAAKINRTTARQYLIKAGYSPILKKRGPEKKGAR